MRIQKFVEFQCLAYVFKKHVCKSVRAVSIHNDFFLIKDYKDDFNNVSVEYVSKITKKLKSLWCNSMTDDEKDKVWQYFESLITLGELACNKTVK